MAILPLPSGGKKSIEDPLIMTIITFIFHRCFFLRWSLHIYNFRGLNGSLRKCSPRDHMSSMNPHGAFLRLQGVWILMFISNADFRALCPDILVNLFRWDPSICSFMSFWRDFWCTLIWEFFFFLICQYPWSLTNGRKLNSKFYLMKYFCWGRRIGTQGNKVQQ